MSDPYDDEDFEPVGPRGRRKGGELDVLDPADAREGDDIDLRLALQWRNDFGNAQRLIQRFGENLIFVKNSGWYVWGETCWDHEGGQAAAMRIGHEVALAIRDEVKALIRERGRFSAEMVDRLHCWAVQSANQPKVHSMLEAASIYLTKQLDLLDANPFLVACQNGTVVLHHNVEFRPSRREDYITRRLGVPFVEGAACPRFLAFLEQVMPDENMRAFVQRIAGYCLTGSTREQCVIIFYGTGRNGKSTFVNVLRHVMGDYAMNSPISTFLAKREGVGGSDASPDIARLPGVRMLTASEPPEGARLDEGMIKAMTSNEVVTARHLNQGFFEFRPKFKLVLSTNHYPVIRGTDLGIWRRIRLVPWVVRIPEEAEDRNLEEKLVAEGPGILQWMLDGAEDWLVRGLDPPEKAKAAVEDYRAAQDPVGEFLSACCELTGECPSPATGRPYEVTAKAMREAYKRWCEEEGLDPLKGAAFVSRLMGKGITKRKSMGRIVYVGVRLNWET